MEHFVLRRRSGLAPAILFAGALAWATPGMAGVISLFDMAINVNGETTCLFYESFCDTDFAPDLSGAGVDDAGFDYDSGLGTLSLTLGGEGAHSVVLFADHEIDEFDNTFYNESGAVNGVAAAGQSFEIDEPGYYFGDIFDHFFDSALDNFNNVPAGLEEDVSMAMGWDFFLGADEVATILFSFSRDLPGGGFYLSQWDELSQDGLYFTSSLSINAAVPSPATWLLMMVGLAGLGLRRLRSA